MATLKQLIDERVLILDGAMGTMIFPGESVFAEIARTDEGQ